MKKCCETCKFCNETDLLCRDCLKHHFKHWVSEETVTEPIKKKRAPKNNLKEAKPDMSLLPLDLLTELLCPAYEVGIKKYWRDSWREGFKSTIMFAACLRHMTAFFFKGEDYDPDALKNQKIKVHHLGSAIFCLISMYDSWKNHPELDNRRKYK